MSKVRNKKQSLKERAYGLQLQVTQQKLDYIRNLYNGRYYAARANMITEQLNSGKIEEKIDGCKKTKELLGYEYALMKMQAINSLTNAYGLKKQLLDTKAYHVTEEEIDAFEKEYLSKPIIRKDYEAIKPFRNKANFVKD